MITALMIMYQTRNKLQLTGNRREKSDSDLLYQETYNHQNKIISFHDADTQDNVRETYMT